MAVKYQDYYDTLGVKRDVSQKEMDRAYRKLTRKYHPDVSKEKDASEKFKRINEAYEVLKNPDKRQKYDQLGSNWKAGQEFSPPPGYEDIRFEFGGREGGGGFQFGQGGFSDFFEVLFGRGGGPGSALVDDLFSGAQQSGATQQRPMQVRPAELAITIGLEDAYHGATRAVDIQWDQPGPDGQVKPISKKLDVKIPAGTKEGSKIRLRGQGPQVNGRASDLILKVGIAPHPGYQLQGHDLITQLPVAPWEAALGAKVTLDTLAGQVTVTIPPGSQSGRKLRLRGKGMPKRAGESGDLLAQIKIVVPEKLSNKDKELFEKLKEQSDFDPRSST